jgi:hypothetical protein
LANVFLVIAKSFLARVVGLDSAGTCRGAVAWRKHWSLLSLQERDITNRPFIRQSGQPSRTREVPCSILGPEAGCLDMVLISLSPYRQMLG